MPQVNEFSWSLNSLKFIFLFFLFLLLMNYKIYFKFKSSICFVTSTFILMV